eukprot:m.509279 g.509279  ORF g.509279 m.509279 type:complete len:276 (+) comp57399_c0_seq2:1038-1865(+)
MFKKLFRKTSKDEGEGEEVAEAAEATDAKPQAKAEPAKGKEDKTKSKPTGDAGASLYLRLQRETEERAKARERGELMAVSAPSFTAKLTATTKAQEAVSTQSQAVRSTRLMKELERIQKCQAVKDGIFSVSLADENLFEWDLKYYKFDPESLLANDVANLQLDTGIDNVWFRFSFPENFPFAPPFVRVLAPLVQGGYVLTGGAICQELLTPDGWVQSCKMEAVILQVAAAITKAGARIVARVAVDFSEAEARKSYDYLVKTHAKYGWRDLEKEDG